MQTLSDDYSIVFWLLDETNPTYNNIFFLFQTSGLACIFNITYETYKPIMFYNMHNCRLFF